MSMDVFVLGSAQDGGLPQLGSRGAASRRARRQPRHRRLAPSLAVVAEDGHTLLVDVSPDVVQQETQLLDTPRYAGRPIDAPPADAILLTHAHMGHYAGLVHFGREAAAARGVPCYVTDSMESFLCRHAPWEQLVRLGNLEPVAALPGRIEMRAGLGVRAFAVPHRAEYTDTVGVSINETLLYVPDIDDWERWPAAREEIGRHRICLLDGTFFDARELPERDRTEVPHPLVTDTVARFRDLARDRRLILTHLNHTNPLGDAASPQACWVAAQGFEIATEMMRFEV
jgi:pyrroloquinoline quinone biosynthesis protein B